MKIKFEGELDYQQHTVHSIVDVFKGQEICNSNLSVYSPAFLTQQKNIEFNQIRFTKY